MLQPLSYDGRQYTLAGIQRDHSDQGCYVSYPIIPSRAILGAVVIVADRCKVKKSASVAVQQSINILSLHFKT